MKRFALAFVALTALISVLPSEATDTVLEHVGVSRVQRDLDDLESRTNPVGADTQAVQDLEGGDF